MAKSLQLYKREERVRQIGDPAGKSDSKSRRPRTDSVSENDVRNYAGSAMSQPAPCVHIPYVQDTIYEYKISVSHSFAQARGQEQGREHDSLFDSACA